VRTAAAKALSENRSHGTNRTCARRGGCAHGKHYFLGRQLKDAKGKWITSVDLYQLIDSFFSVRSVQSAFQGLLEPVRAAVGEC
jgi:hypothetical protein